MNLNLSPCDVMVVDDDSDIREAICNILEDNSMLSVEASNGREALEMLSNGAKPSVILLDIMMPVMDGFQFRELQRADPNLKRIPVIVVSAHIHAQNTAEKMDAALFLRKPLELDSLLSALGKFCDKTQKN